MKLNNKIVYYIYIIIYYIYIYYIIIYYTYILYIYIERETERNKKHEASATKNLH